MRIMMTLLSVTLALTATAQTAGGGISEQMMQQMERQYAAQPANKALRNAIASNAIDNLTKNQDNAGDLEPILPSAPIR